MKEFSTSPLFDRLGIWLISQGLKEASAEEIVQGFGRRLVEGGVSLTRVSLGGFLLHPVFGALDIVWTARDDQILSRRIPRSEITSEAFRNSPFYWATKNKVRYRRFRLDAAAADDPRFPIFERLRESGVTDYILFFESYGRSSEVAWTDLPAGSEGILLALCTSRIDGFSELELAYLQAMFQPLALAIKSASTYLLARELLHTYVGKHSGSRVLQGSVERGDLGVIDCILFYSDLRASTQLAEQLEIDAFMRLINEYFDCSAGAVADHGGEILKFIGDAVMAIFPIDPETRPAVDMCRSAMTAAREAFQRAELANDTWRRHGAEIRFGIALHRGTVMYGNVGIGQRLDFTTIGPAVNQVQRLEGLTRDLQIPIVASDAFRDEYKGPLVSRGRHLLRGMDQEIEAFTVPQ